MTTDKPFSTSESPIVVPDEQYAPEDGAYAAAAACYKVHAVSLPEPAFYDKATGAVITLSQLNARPH